MTMEQPKREEEIQTSTPGSDIPGLFGTPPQANQILCPECSKPLQKDPREVDIFYCINVSCHLYKDRHHNYKTKLQQK